MKFEVWAFEIESLAFEVADYLPECMDCAPFRPLPHAFGLRDERTHEPCVPTWKTVTGILYFNRSHFTA
nr:hypothetical protein [Segatella maculosa]